MNWPAIFWLVMMVVFLLVESNTVTVVSVWFAVGALASMIVSFLGGELWLQAVIFFVVSGVLLALLRPILRKYFTPKLVKTNVDAIIGTKGVVTAAIDNIAAVGEVKLGAMLWTARSTSGDPIKEGTVVQVDRIEGVKVFVTEAEVPAKE